MKAMKHTSAKGHTMQEPKRVAIGGASGSGGYMPAAAGKKGTAPAPKNEYKAGTRLAMGR